MTSSLDITNEIAARIEADVRHFGGELPDRFSVAWRAYLAATLEWSVIEETSYRQLLALLPPVVDDPAMTILTGRD